MVACLAAAVAVAAEPGRPVMREMPPGGLDRPPSQRELVDARVELRRRFREPLARATSAAGANQAVETLLDAAGDEEDRSLKWLMLVEARRLAGAAGNAPAVDRAIVLASASFEFDAVAEELRDLGAIPLQGLDPSRAAGLAQVAERLATRAQTDGRRGEAVAAQTLAVRAWQRTGDKQAAARAAARGDAL